MMVTHFLLALDVWMTHCLKQVWDMQEAVPCGQLPDGLGVTNSVVPSSFSRGLMEKAHQSKVQE